MGNSSWYGIKYSIRILLFWEGVILMFQIKFVYFSPPPSYSCPQGNNMLESAEETFTNALQLRPRDHCIHTSFIFCRFFPLFFQSFMIGMHHSNQKRLGKESTIPSEWSSQRESPIALSSKEMMSHCLFPPKFTIQVSSTSAASSSSSNGSSNLRLLRSRRR